MGYTCPSFHMSLSHVFVTDLYINHPPLVAGSTGPRSDPKSGDTTYRSQPHCSGRAVRQRRSSSQTLSCVWSGHVWSSLFSRPSVIQKQAKPRWSTGNQAPRSLGLIIQRTSFGAVGQGTFGGSRGTSASEKKHHAQMHGALMHREREYGSDGFIMFHRSISFESRFIRENVYHVAPIGFDNRIWRHQLHSKKQLSGDRDFARAL